MKPMKQSCQAEARLEAPARHVLRRITWGVAAAMMPVLAVLPAQPTQALPFFANTWESLYPDSLSIEALFDAGGSSCLLCHAELSGGEPWNAYGWAIRGQLAHLEPPEAILAVESMNADGDLTGCSNIAEIESNTQPGWRAGPTNTVYFSDGTIWENVTPPPVQNDPTQACCPGDVDGSGSVGTGDLLDLLAAWGPNPGHPADLDGDGSVGTSDLLVLLANWGPCEG